MNQYKTESHSEELELIFNQDKISLKEKLNSKSAILRDFQAYFRLIKKKTSNIFPGKPSQDFNNILYLTLDCPPYTENSLRLDSPSEYINAMRKQYPENNFSIMIPLINLNPENIKSSKIIVEINEIPRILEKTSIRFKFFTQNRTVSAVVYKFPKCADNIQVFGICSSAFSFCKNVSEISKLHYLAPFLKAARIAIRKLNKENFIPNIIHSENIPFFMGEELGKNFPNNIKVLQTIKDYTQIDMAKSELFWAAINIADKAAMKKICNDSIIKKCVATLFKLRNAKHFCKIDGCLKFIYKNYSKFRKYIDKGEDIEENVLFNKLNTRILELFPQMSHEEDLFFNPYIHTLKRASFRITTSETYYNDIFENPKLSGNMYKQLVKTKNKSDYVLYGIDTDKYGFNAPREVYQGFNSNDFREVRNKNKTAILKEFSASRIKTNFIDPTLFQEEAQIVGSLDTFYDSPLLFAHANTEIFAQGIDILFNTILKLFELHKSFQAIICIKDGLKINFIKSWIEFLQKNKHFDGKWVFIDGKVNLSKFYASSDMTLIPRRANLNSPEHFIAMHYGCIPVVSRCGILNDTVSDIFDDITNGCGLKTKTSLLTEEDSNELFLIPIMKALNIYQHNPSSWNLLIKNSMLKNCNWNFEILEKYQKIYEGLL